MIKISNLNLKLDNFKLTIPSLTIEPGYVTLIKGPNGSGKTTLQELICGLILTYNREIQIDEKKPSETKREVLSAYLNKRFLIEFLSPLEYFDFIVKINNVSENSYAEFKHDFFDFIGLDIINSGQFICTLSEGQKAKIGISAAFIDQPKYVILDEPFANLDKKSKALLISIINNYVSIKNKSIVITSHIEISIKDDHLKTIFLQDGNLVKKNSKGTL